MFSFGDYEGTVYIDNVSLTTASNPMSIVPNGNFENGADGWVGWGNESSRGLSSEGEGYGGAADQIIEKTPEEKKQIIGEALEKWIAEMVTHCKPYVKAWDVVNEPMSDWPDPYDLKTGVGRTDLATDEFFWQDYLGYDYAIQAFKLARQYGNEDDIHFINDYGLEYNLDKCKGLIEYMEHIEREGARVDGIGTQMHISLDVEREKIVESFKLLAATGKLVKVSELDIGLNVTTSTPEILQQQADLYRFVVDAYMEHIPAEQRYGITVWSPTDSPEHSSWRAGEEIGLWKLNYNRKPAYAGFANGLAGRDVSAEFEK